MFWLKKFNWVFYAIGTTLCLGVLLFVVLSSRIPTKGESVSPDGTYLIRIGWNETEVWPHHASPLDVELQGYQAKSKKRLFALRTTLDNDKGNALMGEEIRIIWESDSRAVILLLGKYQIPEVITVNFTEDFPTPKIIRERSYSAAQGIFLEQKIPLSDLVGIKD